jgi:DNA-binding NarL/FixJ family response regulator
MANALGSARPKGSTTIVIVDASRMDCQLLVEAIQRYKDFAVRACATDSDGAISAVRENQPDIVVLSARLQDGERAGLVVLQTLRALHLPSRAVVLLDNEEPELVVEVFRHGARGIFCRTGASREFRKCIQSVRDGKVWANNTHWEWIVSALAQDPGARPGSAQTTKALSKREEEVARLVASALSNRELSQKLGLSEHTVKNYLSRIFEKLGVSTRTELALHVLSWAKPTANEELLRSLHEKHA